MTELQRIEQELKQNFGNSMEPYTLELLSRYMELKGVVGSGNSSSSTNTFDFPADPSLDGVLHKNRLVMNDGGVAKLLNYEPPTPGVKGKYKVTLQAPTKTIGAIWELPFTNNLDEDDQFEIRYFIEGVQRVTPIFAKTTPVNSDEFAIGATISDTIDNLIALVLSLGFTGTCWQLTRVGGDVLRADNKNIFTGTDINNAFDYALPEMYNSQYPGHTMLSISTNGGANNNNWTATQVQLGEEGAYAVPYIDYILAQNQNGNVLQIGNYNGNQYISLLPFIQNSVSAAADYMGWNMANSDTEFAQIYFDAFNAHGYFVATDLGINGNNPNEFIIEEAVAQTGTDAYSYFFPIYNDFFSNVFYYTLITTPQAGLGINLKKRLLGSLVDIVGGMAKIDSSHVITGKLATGINITYADNVDWSNEVQDLITSNCILMPGPNGELIDYLTLIGLGYIDSQDIIDIAFLGQVYLALENKVGGEEIRVRPILLSN